MDINHWSLNLNKLFEPNKKQMYQHEHKKKLRVKLADMHGKIIQNQDM